MIIAIVREADPFSLEHAPHPAAKVALKVCVVHLVLIRNPSLPWTTCVSTMSLRAGESEQVPR